LLDRPLDVVLVSNIATVITNGIMCQWTNVVLRCSHDAIRNSGLLVRSVLLLEPLLVVDIV
jgi:hypothetical protein